MELRFSFGFVLIVFPFLQVAECSNYTALYTGLFANYEPKVLPKCELSGSVQLQINIALRQLVGLNEPRQIIELNTWIRLVWNDCQLTWNATETGINSIAVPYESIWVPDITLFDNAENMLGGLKHYRPNIYSDGSVYYNFPSLIKSLCKVDVTYFPFDIQTCKLVFGSWSHHGLDLNLTQKAEAGDLSSYVENGEWNILGIPAKRNVKYYGCCPEPFPDVTYYLLLKRKPLFYLLNLLFPCMLISTMGVLGFLLPPDSGEKVSLEITVLLSLAVFLLVVSETMPPTSETFPFIGVYFALSMLLISISTLMTVIVLNLHFKGNLGKKMPQWVRCVFLHHLGHYLHVKTVPHTKVVNNRNKIEPALENSIPVTNTSEKCVQENNVNNTLLGQEIIEIKDTNLKLIDLENPEVVETANETVTLLQQQLKCLGNISAYMEEKQENEANLDEWQLLAVVIDRVFLIVFVLFLVITSLVVMIRIATANPEHDLS